MDKKFLSNKWWLLSLVFSCMAGTVQTMNRQHFMAKLAEATSQQQAAIEKKRENARKLSINFLLNPNIMPLQAEQHVNNATPLDHNKEHNNVFSETTTTNHTNQQPSIITQLVQPIYYVNQTINFINANHTASGSGNNSGTDQHDQVWFLDPATNQPLSNKQIAEAQFMKKQHNAYTSGVSKEVLTEAYQAIVTLRKRYPQLPLMSLRKGRGRSHPPFLITQILNNQNASKQARRTNSESNTNINTPPTGDSHTSSQMNPQNGTLNQQQSHPTNLRNNFKQQGNKR